MMPMGIASRKKFKFYLMKNLHTKNFIVNDLCIRDW